MVEPNVIPTDYTCEKIQEDALALLGSELTDEQERQVLIHLATCEHCREEARRDRLMMHMLSACPSITASPSFEDDLAKRLSMENIKNPAKNESQYVIPPTPILRKKPKS